MALRSFGVVVFGKMNLKGSQRLFYGLGTDGGSNFLLKEGSAPDSSFLGNHLIYQ